MPAIFAPFFGWPTDERLTQNFVWYLPSTEIPPTSSRVRLTDQRLFN
jgi:hypothetical protein